MARWGTWVLCLVVWMGGVGVAWADLLYLSDGRKVEGIITQETDSHIEVQVLWQGYMTVPRGSILSIVRGNRQDRQRLLKKWQKDFLADQTRERKKATFEAAQRAKGLVKYEGEWITAEQLALIQKREREEKERKEKEAREEEARRVEQRLQALEEENQRLRRQVEAQTELIFRFRQGIVVHHNNPSLFQDDQGNLIRVQEELGQKFFITTDGKRVDVKSHEGHLTFTDDQEIHRDLRQVAH